MYAAFAKPRHKNKKIKAHLSILVINKQIPRTLVVQVGDLQAVSVADLLWLKNSVQVLHGDHSFGNLGLGFKGRIEEGFQKIRTAFDRS